MDRKSPIILFIAVAVVVASIAFYIKLSREGSAPDAQYELARALESLSAASTTPFESLSDEQKRALESLSAPADPPEEASAEEIEQALRSLQAR